VQSAPAAYRGITVLTGEGGRLRNGGRLVRGKDYELVPERLWKFLAQMYGGSPSLPRQVIRLVKIFYAIASSLAEGKKNSNR
jgi:hypothetical protein